MAEYNINNNSTGTYNTVWLQPSPDTATSNSGHPDGGLGYIAVNPSTNTYYVEDGAAFKNLTPAQDDTIYVGSLTGTTAQRTPNTFTQVTVQNPGPTTLGTLGLSLDNAPTLAVTNSTPTFTESANNPASANNTPVTLITGATTTDADTALLPGGTGDPVLASATVSISSGFFAGDTLSVNLTTTGGHFTGTNISSSYNSNTGVLTLTGADTLAHYQTVLNAVQLTSTSDNPTNYGADTSRTITFTVSDGLLSSAAQTSTVTVVGTDDPPVNHLPGTAPSGNEDTTFSITGLSITDVDADPANQNITVALSVSHGTLTLSTGVANGVTSGEVTGNNSSSLSITATQNQINATLANGTGLQYLGNANFNTGFATETLHIVSSDLGNTGTGGPPERDQRSLHYRQRGERSAEPAAAYDHGGVLHRERRGNGAVRGRGNRFPAGRCRCLCQLFDRQPDSRDHRRLCGGRSDRATRLLAIQHQRRDADGWRNRHRHDLRQQYANRHGQQPDHGGNRGGGR
jgi:hypothetical protein